MEGRPPLVEPGDSFHEHEGEPSVPLECLRCMNVTSLYIGSPCLEMDWEVGSRSMQTPRVPRGCGSKHQLILAALIGLNGRLVLGN